MKLKFLAPLCMVFMLAALPAGAKNIYVDVNSKSTVEDGTQENPYKKIQTAADLVESGDIVLVNPGLYYESVTLTKNGTADKPIVFKAVNNGLNETVITGADRNIREGKVKWKLEDEKEGIYSIPWNQNVSMVLYNGAKMFGYTSYEELRTFEAWNGTREDPDTCEGYPHGFYWDAAENKLYIHIAEDDKYGDEDPNKNLMCVSGPYYDTISMPDGKTYDAYRHSGVSTGSYNFGVITEDSAYVRISGFTFETPGWCGVFTRSSDVTVSNCWFRGCMTAVHGGRYHMYDTGYVAENITIENCDMTHWPLFEDAMDKVAQPEQKFPYKYFWWCCKATVRGLHDHEQGGLVLNVGRNWIIRNNYVWSIFEPMSGACSDGPYVTMQLEPGTSTKANTTINDADGVQIYGNRFEGCLDNAFELENHTKNYDIHHNEFINIFLPVSWQPLGGREWPTNAKIHHNVFFDEQWMIDLFLEKANYPLEWLKFGANTSQWATAYPLRFDKLIDGVADRPIWMQDKGIWVYNNSVYIPKGYTSEIVGALGGMNQKEYAPGKTYNNSYVYNNLIYTRAQTEDKPFRTYIKTGEFLAPNGGYGFYSGNNLCIASNPTDVEVVKETEEGWGYSTLEDAGVEFDGELMTLTENSPGRGAGIQVEIEECDTTDVGAVPYGEKWDIRYGVFAHGDVNCDGAVDLADVAYLSERIGADVNADDYSYRCDLDFNGIIDENDLKLLSDNYFSQN